MPELPEVETIVADLRPHLVGRTIVRCELAFPTIVRHPEPEEFVDAVAGMRIESMGRRGKYILARLAPSRPFGPDFPASGEELLLVVHLGMTGQLRLVDEVVPLAKHTHAVFFLDDGRQLRYRDPRRFGRLLVGTQEALLSARKMPRLGPEPIDPDFAAEQLYRQLRRRSAPLKAVLLDQKAIAGVGNIYADESATHAVSLLFGHARREHGEQAVRAAPARIAARIAGAGDRQSRQLRGHVSRRVGRGRRTAGEAARVRARRRAMLHVRTSAELGAHRRPDKCFLPPLPALASRLFGIAALGVVFIALTIAITTGVFTDLDLQVAQAMHAVQQPSLHPLFQVIAELGGFELTTVLIFGLGYYLWRSGFNLSDGLGLVAIFIAAQAFELYYKLNLYQPVPPRSLAQSDGPSITETFSGSGMGNSFPSGHLLRAVIVYGLLIWSILRYRRRKADPLSDKPDRHKGFRGRPHRAGHGAERGPRGIGAFLAANQTPADRRHRESDSKQNHRGREDGCGEGACDLRVDR